MNDNIIGLLISNIGAIGVAAVGSGGAIAFLVSRHKKSQESSEDEKPKALLVHHQMHASLHEYIRESDSYNYGVDNPGRKLLARDFLVNKLSSWETPAQEFAKLIDEVSSTQKFNGSEADMIFNSAMDMFNRGMTYERNFINPSDGPKDMESKAIFRDKFFEFHSDRIERFKAKIKAVCYDTNTYCTCYQKGARILEALDDALFDTVQEARHTAGKLNGQLNGKWYKGYEL